MSRAYFRWIGAATLGLAMATTSSATWSIVITNSETKEVGVATVTCLEGFDLLGFVPVVAVGEGAGAVQAAGDFDGTRRQFIRKGLAEGTSPAEVLAALARFEYHDVVQYGIVDTSGESVTYSGEFTESWSGGVTGSIGPFHYAIQGNVLVGECVVPAIEDAIVSTDGTLPERLMAGMLAAREAGGDGRCSCSYFDPDGCDCPPPFFVKTGHVGGMIVARLGDDDDPDCDAAGCADGKYYMRLDAEDGSFEDLDPVYQVRDKYEALRTWLLGRPDALESTARCDPAWIDADGVSTTTMTITPRDWLSRPVTGPVVALTIEHAPDSAGIASIGAVYANNDGTFRATLTAGTEAGLDRFRVTIVHGNRATVLMPESKVASFLRSDLNNDGLVNYDDLFIMLSEWGRCPLPPAKCTADLTGNGVVDLADLLVLFADWDR